MCCGIGYASTRERISALRWQRGKSAPRVLLAAQIGPADIASASKVDLAEPDVLEEWLIALVHPKRYDVLERELRWRQRQRDRRVMFEQDYLVRLLLQFFKGVVRSVELAREHGDPEEAADVLETAIGEATEIDGAVLLSLTPDSIAQVMQATAVDPNVTQFVARSMLLESVYLHEAGDAPLAELRAAQARAIAAAYGFDLPPDPADFDSITEGLEEAALAGRFDIG